MYFRTFTMGTDTEKRIEKAGFRVNSFHEIKTFQGCEEENTSLRPKDYYFDGSVWKEMDSSCFSERILLLCRMPLLSFEELWHSCFIGKKEDRFGALSIIANQYTSEMISQIRSTTKEQSNNKVFRKKLAVLKTNPIITNCLRAKQIISAIDDLGLDG